MNGNQPVVIDHGKCMLNRMETGFSAIHDLMRQEETMIFAKFLPETALPRRQCQDDRNTGGCIVKRFNAVYQHRFSMKKQELFRNFRIHA